MPTCHNAADTCCSLSQDGSYPRMDKLLHESPTGGADGDEDMPLGTKETPSLLSRSLIQT